MTMKLLFSCNGRRNGEECRGWLPMDMGASAWDTLGDPRAESPSRKLARAGWHRMAAGVHLCPSCWREWRAEQLALHGHLAMAVDEIGDGPVPDIVAARFVCWCPDGEECTVVPARDAG